MKLIVQKRDSGIEIGGDMESLKEVKEDRKTLIEDGPFVYRVAIALLRVFPRFKYNKNSGFADRYNLTVAG